MKYSYLLGRVFSSLFFVSLLIEAHGATHPKCPGENGYQYTNYRIRNPQQGGFVSNQAYVDDTDDRVFIGPEAVVCGSSNINGHAKIYGNAVINGAEIDGQAQIFGNARVESLAVVKGEAKVSGDAVIRGSVLVEGKAFIAGNAEISNAKESDYAVVTENARITENAKVTENAQIKGSARIQGNAVIKGNAVVGGTALVSGCAILDQGITESGTVTVQGTCTRVLSGNNFPESKHPYLNQTNEVSEYHLPGYGALLVTFDERTQFEQGRDHLIINGTTYSAAALAGKTIRVYGDRLIIRLTSDHSNTFWGYKVTDVKGMTKAELEQESLAIQRRGRFVQEREEWMSLINNEWGNYSSNQGKRMYKMAGQIHPQNDCHFEIHVKRVAVDVESGEDCYFQSTSFPHVDLRQFKDLNFGLNGNAISLMVHFKMPMQNYSQLDAYRNQYCSFRSEPKTRNSDTVTVAGLASSNNRATMERLAQLTRSLAEYCQTH